MTSDWRPSVPPLDAAAVRDVLRDHAVVAIHFWASWNGYDRAFDEVLRALRVEFAERVAFHAIDFGRPDTWEFVDEGRVVNIPALGLWVRGRPWRTVIGLRTRERLRAEIDDAVRHSVSRPQNIEVRTPSGLDEPSFTSQFTSLGLAPRAGLFARLVASYSEPHRAYHTLLHLGEARSALADCGDRVQRWDEAGIALWFHDAIYDTHRDDNEERSADWARDELLTAGAAADVAERVHALVLATKHRDPPEGNDARLLVDADLAILAAPSDRFAAYERQIRQEYGWVPEPQFREAREKFLRGMLARPSIFHDPGMRDLHEAHARRNVEESLRRMGSRTS